MEVGPSGQDPEEWLGEVQSTWLSYEHNPFTRKSFFSEAGTFASMSASIRASWKCRSATSAFLTC